MKHSRTLVSPIWMAVPCALALCCERPRAEPAKDAASSELPRRTVEAPPEEPARRGLDCEAADAPPGMVCIPGGPAVIGSDEHGRREAPRHEVEISTFFIDQHEVTNAEYERCEAAGVCLERSGLPKSYEAYLADDLPAIPMTFDMAQRYCVWAGKRLPTEAEWEKVARGPTGYVYPWGNESPTCERAHYKGCMPRTTQPIGSYAAGHYGVFDMAGNGYEWVKDWAADCYDGCSKPCGAACLGHDPQGPCGGAPTCEGFSARTLKGGSWYWPAEQMRGAWRRGQRPASGLHRLSFRCASSTPVLARAPLWHLQPRPALTAPEAPGSTQLASFRAVRDDTDIMTIPECTRQGVATHDCRDPMSYIKTNEGGLPLWTEYIRNLGGGYLGLGSDQSYHFIAEAKSRWAWIFDYDPVVMQVHYILRAVAQAKATPREFVDAYRLRNMEDTKALVRASLADQPTDVEPTLRTLESIRGQLFYHYNESLTPRPAYPDFGWLANAEHYRYIRHLFRQGRILLRKGNMLTDVVLPDVAKSARALGVPIRVYYSSNADDQWVLSQQYRDNLLELPFDEQSVVLRTLLGKHWDTDLKWVYVVHAGLHMQEKLRRGGYDRVEYFMEDRLPTTVHHLFTIGLPGLAPSGRHARARGGVSAQ